MKIIFDENIPRPLRQFFPTDDISSVQESGWAGQKNGELLAKIDWVFDVFVLADKNLRYQQKLLHRKIGIVELPTNRWPLLKLLAPRIIIAVHAATPGSYVVIQE